MKRLLTLLYVLAFMILLATLGSCVDDEVQAKKTLNGVWKITSIQSFYGQFFADGGHNILDVKTEEGDLGYFDFDAQGVVTYNFIRNDTTYENSTNWSLHSSNEHNSGFKTTKYTLKIVSDFEFEVLFGDGARNSQVDARRLEFTHWPNQSGYGVGIVMHLSKQ